MDVAEYNKVKAAADELTPSGAWAGAPSLAATTVPMTNTSGRTVTVDISGGTVTVIKVNGTTTGFTTGSFRVRAGETLAITYSSAPTVAWYYESANVSSPSGAWAGAPSLAATTVPMTNTSGYAVAAYISAGTVTVVKVDGVTTGLRFVPAEARKHAHDHLQRRAHPGLDLRVIIVRC
jgi:hypothetical protein